MKKIIFKLGVLSLIIFSAFFVNVSEVEAQSDCTPNGCWKTITSRAGWPAMYCGTCTYIDNSRGVGSDTGICYQCPQKGG